MLYYLVLETQKPHNNLQQYLELCNQVSPEIVAYIQTQFKSAYCQILHTSSVHSLRVYCTMKARVSTPRCLRSLFWGPTYLPLWGEVVYGWSPLSPTSVVLTDQKKTVHFWAALHFYSIANFVASWLKWLQMITNDSKWLHLTHDSFGVLSDHLESFKSNGDKIIYTINMQRS